ncbi:MAG TPA: hypothetical protein VHZ98_16245 [Galbitalea sp.]|jgi:hypothetical protein|nr:hypothetical protein [Galbitalea sp.]
MDAKVADSAPPTVDLAAEQPTKAEMIPSDREGISRPMTAAEISLLVELAVQLQVRFPDGMPTFTAERTYQLAGKMLDAYPADWSIPEIGPAYDAAALARYWGMSERTVRRRVTTGELFAITTARGRYLYPSFQFGADMTVLPGLFDLIAAVRVAIPDYNAIAIWLATRPTQPSPAGLLFSGDVTAALDRAREVTTSAAS